MSNKKMFKLLVICTFMVFFLGSGYGLFSGENNVKNQGNDAPTTPIKASISLDHYPGVNSPVTVNCELISTLDAPGTTAQIELPANARFIRGTLNWNGDLLSNVPVTFSATIKFAKEGNAKVLCRVNHIVNDKSSWGDLAATYISVGKEKGSKGFKGMENRQFKIGEVLEAGTGQIIEEAGQAQISTLLPEVDEAAPSVIPSASSSTTQPPSLSSVNNDAQIAGTLTVTGRWGYYGRDDAYTGAREFIVELVRGDTSAHLAWAYTDLNGYYTFAPVTNPGAAGVRTIMKSYTSYNPNSDVLAVVNPDWGTTGSTANAFGTATPTTVLADGTQNIGSWVSSNGSNYERAYWVQRDLVDTWRYIWFGAGSSQSPQETTGSCTVEWKIDSTHGTHYHRGGNVHLDGEDPLSDTVVIHEFGHNIMYTVYGNWMPTTYCPSPHYIQRDSHVNCAWTEGWANFLPMAVNNDPYYRWDSGASLNLETPTWGTSGWDNGDDVEGRVAGALWDILDTVNDGDDTYSDGSVANIWDTLYHQNDDNFSQFWSAWQSRGHTYTGPLNAIYQNTIDY